MFVKDVIMDGFKSYRGRVGLENFDPHFTAFTGEVNTSGKSEILDGILFVLDLGSCINIRYHNWSALILQEGRVRRASVSVIFDNVNKSRSPATYEDCDEIIVTRAVEKEVESNGSELSVRNQFYLNEIVSTKEAIQAMLESAGLNISIPNFLLTKDWLRKVGNMCPMGMANLIDRTNWAKVYKEPRDEHIQNMLKMDKEIGYITELVADVEEPGLAGFVQYLQEVQQRRAQCEVAVNKMDADKLSEQQAVLERMNEAVGLFMSKLLPETTARLVPVSSELRLEDGVRTQIHMNGVWKSSFAELSKEQVSLVVLALVLGICKNDPAPFYVIDDFDPGLDPRQNNSIREIICQHLTGSQLICASIKDGIYTDANVMYTTQLTQQGSSVVRSSTVQDMY